MVLLCHRLSLATVVVIVLAISFPALSPAREDGTPRGEIKNVLVIVLDALRADHLGIYGYPRDTSPNIDRLARKGIIFDRAVVSAGWTRPSVTSYFTALHPGVHGVNTGKSVIPGNLTTMSEIFQQNGYFTFGFVNNPNIDAQWGFDRGFNVYEQMSDYQIIKNAGLALLGQYFDNTVLDAIKDRFTVPFQEEKVGVNLVRNPGFEDGTAGWECPEGWLTKETVYSGDGAAHISRISTNQKNFHSLHQELTVDYGWHYLFGAMVKTKDLKDDVCVEIKKFKSREDHPFPSTKRLTGTNDWTLLWGILDANSYEVLNDTKNTSEIELRVGRVTDFEEGEFWIDDAFVLLSDSRTSFRPSEKLFLYLHLLDPHAPYVPNIPVLMTLQDLTGPTLIDKYDAEIKFADQELGILLEGLESQGILDETLVIITSDHGEAFGEHGWWKHGSNYYYEEVARVPLIFYNPVLFPEPRRIEQTVSLSLDLLPTLVDLLKLNVPAGTQLQGRSLFESAPPPEQYKYFYVDSYLLMVTDDHWKFINNEYSSTINGTSIRTRNQGDEGTLMEIQSGSQSDEMICRNREELENWKPFLSLEPEVQKEVLDIFDKTSSKKMELYDLKNDPEELNNVAERYPARVETFQRLIRSQHGLDRKLLAQSGITPEEEKDVSESMRKKLRALGYAN